MNNRSRLLNEDNLANINRGALWAHTQDAYCPHNALEQVARRAQLPLSSGVPSLHDGSMREISSKSDLGLVNWGTTDQGNSSKHNNFRQLANGNAAFRFAKSTSGPGVSWIAVRR